MLNFEELVEGLANNKDRVNDYFTEFFTKTNFKNYELDNDLDSDDLKAIKTMFESRKELNKRVNDAFKHNPLCLEAFFVYYILNEDVFVNYRFETYYSESNSFADFTAYEKKCYIRILDFYVEFLLDIHNITTAIKVQRLIIRLTNDLSRKNVSRLSYMYSTIEECNDFYRLYLECEFDAYDYLLLLVTLLKHDEKVKAKEVLLDMFKNVKYSEYLDHLWDLDDKDKEQQEFYKCVEDCYSEISSVPGFFSWVNRINEER